MDVKIAENLVDMDPDPVSIYNEYGPTALHDFRVSL
jgi:hypothetical protein